MKKFLKGYMESTAVKCNSCILRKILEIRHLLLRPPPPFIYGPLFSFTIMLLRSFWVKEAEWFSQEAIAFLDRSSILFKNGRGTSSQFLLCEDWWQIYVAFWLKHKKKCGSFSSSTASHVPDPIFNICLPHICLSRECAKNTKKEVTNTLLTIIINTNTGIFLSFASKQGHNF